jgi:hypothetical protein
MACLKCGSDWVTKKGKDMVSCPECCKQQRCKARKQGRLPAEESKRCERCGCEFTASGGNAMARSRHCSACFELARQEYLQARKDRIRSGEWKTKPQGKLKGRKCLRCGKKLRKNQSKYCGGECYNAAKKEGIQSWDRTGQLESIWHRGGRWACAPSRKPIAEMRGNMHAFLRKVGRLYARKLCEICGGSTHGPSARFCSTECLTKSASEVPCFKCGSPCVARGVSRRKMCDKCLVEAKREERKTVKQEIGTYRKKCRKYGGNYVAGVTRRKVFERDGWRCHVCKKKCLKHWANNHPLEATVDHHPIPLSKGGDHDWHNVRCAHRKCNEEKGNKWDGQRRLALEFQ